MNIWMLQPKDEDVGERAVALGMYYGLYTMMHLAIVVADTEQEARDLLADKAEEEVYRLPDMVKATLIGNSIDPYNKPQVIDYACGTG